MYNLGAIGLGHWVKRLHHVLEKGNKMKLLKAVALKTYEERKDELESYGIAKDRYFNVNSDGKIPTGFFRDIDVVQIASHNKFHFNQLLQCLSNRKLTIVEKTLAVNRDEFNQVMEYIKTNNYERLVLPHLHYLTKALTLEMKNILPQLIADHGRITNFDTVFLEKADEEDTRRGWVFSPEHGGIFMDLIHPVEILVQILKADLDELTDARTYIVKPEYDSKNPSAVQVIYKVSGSKFAKDAVATIKLGKGFDMASDKKIMRLYFEDGTFIEFEYLNTEEELATGKRGSWKLFKSEEGGAKLLESKEVQGLLSYETLINEVVKILQGGEMPLTLDEIKRMYESEWQFQEISKDLKPITDKEEIKKLTEGI